MRTKVNQGFWGLFLFAWSVCAIATPPKTLTFENNERLTVDLSTKNTNKIIVKGEKITDWAAPLGFAVIRASKTDGGLFVALDLKKSFVLYLQTNRGSAVSLLVEPRKIVGQTLVLTSVNEPEKPDVLTRWEKNSDYQKLLVQVNRAVINGNTPEGFMSVDIKKPQTVPWKFKKDGPVVADASIRHLWRGYRLMVLQFQVVNRLKEDLILKPSDFYAQGVRSVQLQNEVVPLKQSTMVYVVVDAK